MDEIIRKNKFESVSIGKKNDLITLKVDYDAGSEYSTGRIDLTKNEVEKVIKYLEKAIE